jgi:signal transduction histidine kinase
VPPEEVRIPAAVKAKRGMNTRRRTTHVTRRLRSYAESISDRARSTSTPDISWLLDALVNALEGQYGAAWLARTNPSDLPAAIVPRGAPREFVRAARQWARATLNGRPGASRTLAGFSIGTDDHPLGIFVVGWNRGGRTDRWRREPAAAITRFLRVALAHSAAAHDRTDVIQATEPSRVVFGLLGTLAHEMRTPLTTIKGYATTLMEHPRAHTPAARLVALRAIEQETSTLTQLITELLEAAAINSGHLTFSPEPVLVNRIVERLAAEFAGRTPRHRFVLSFPSPWPVIRGDPRRLEMAFRNILDNAVKYSPRGGLVAVSGVARRREVVISIADQGIGIAPVDLNRLFDRFFRARRAAGVPGSGLGLPIARAIVERHGGRIWAESALGKGTTLHVALPRRPAHSS